MQVGEHVAASCFIPRLTSVPMLQREMNERVLHHLNDDRSKSHNAYTHSSTRKRDVTKKQADQVSEVHGEELMYQMKKVSIFNILLSPVVSTHLPSRMKSSIN